MIGFNILFSVFFNKKNKDEIMDIILLFILIFLEPDYFIYHETYDPLLYFIFFILIKNKIYLNFTKMLTNKKLILLCLFSISFYVLSVFKTIHNQIEMPIYYPLEKNLSYDMNNAKSIY